MNNIKNLLESVIEEIIGGGESQLVFSKPKNFENKSFNSMF